MTFIKIGRLKCRQLIEANKLLKTFPDKGWTLKLSAELSRREKKTKSDGRKDAG